MIPNANAATYTTNTAGTYVVKVLQDNCTAFSQSLLITTSTLQARTIADGTTNLCNGGTAKLIANTGTNLQYQWLKDGIAVATATQSTFTAREKGNYVVNVTQGKCAVKSAAIAVTASGAVPLSPISPNTDITNCDGKAITIATNIDATYKYQWTKDGKNISNATLYNYGVSQTGTYQVVVTNSQCYSVSPSVKLNFGGVQANIAPEVAKVLTQPNKAVTFYASTGSGLTYQWLKNGINIANATASTYATSIEGTYSVRVTNSLCSAMSIGVLLAIGNATKVNGVPRAEENLILDLFPNPVEEKLTVRFYAESVLTEDPHVEIYNILGSKIHESTLQSSQVEQEFQTDLDVSQWLTGAYFIRVFTREKAISKGFMKK